MNHPRKQVTLRLPQETITRVAKIATLAGVSPTQVYNVFLAAYCAEVVEKVRDQRANIKNER
jgi:hypothetical protein